ncbi:hypothetical protein [Shewanella salipaludis]|uniref:Uncharacterized protein n=1 Tax=Shewanella salipaludis TaxID=2723052 RepID=A0A972G4Q9_9GAMM|nr:hypothetical protein [Shewanella salipaludis]NMH67199.1 hypothetical protein [Shewanella salipaludis]
MDLDAEAVLGIESYRRRALISAISYGYRTGFSYQIAVQLNRKPIKIYLKQDQI